VSGEPPLFANVGAEGGRVPAAARDTVRAVATLWAWGFGEGRTVRLPDGEPLEVPAWPSALGPRSEAPVFPWLAEAPPAWWPGDPDWPEADPEAAAVARALHDKGFAQAFAEAEGWVPRPLRGCTRVLDPEELADADAFGELLRAAVAAWPAWLDGAFALKPRLGTSGRGRVGGRLAELERCDWRGALPRLAARGGAVLEPWLPRIDDASCQVAVTSEGVSLLGTLQLRNRESGGYRGHAGEIDSRGRVYTGLAWDETLREAGAALAAASAGQGYRGPAGLDALSFRGPDGEEQVRPVVEWNARSTTGTVVLGLLRRALPALRHALGLGPGERRAFEFALDAPPEWDEAARSLGERGWLVRLGEPGGLAPALLFGPDRAALASALASAQAD